MFSNGFMLLDPARIARQSLDDDFGRGLQRIEDAAADLVENNCDSIIFSVPLLEDEIGTRGDQQYGLQVVCEKTDRPKET